MVRHRLLAGVVGGLVRGRGRGAVHGMKLLAVAGVLAVRHRVVRGRGGGAAQVLKRTDHHDGVLFPVVSRADIAGVRTTKRYYCNTIGGGRFRMAETSEKRNIVVQYT